MLIQKVEVKMGKNFCLSMRRERGGWLSGSPCLGLLRCCCQSVAMGNRSFQSGGLGRIWRIGHSVDRYENQCDVHDVLIAA